MLRIDRVAEASMETFWNHHEAGHFDESLVVLQSLGYRQEALTFALDPDSYYFPNRGGDRFVRPAGVDSDRLPVIALEKGSMYHFEKPSLHNLQRRALEATGIARPALQDITHGFAKQSDAVVTSNAPGSTASVYQRLTAIEQVDDALIASKPALIFEIDPAEPAAESCPSATLHEIAHVMQTLSDPLYRRSERLRRELEAYAVQAKLVLSLEVDYSLNTAMAGTVDRFRLRYLGDTYEPTDFFIEQFQKEPLLSKVWRSVAN